MRAVGLVLFAAFLFMCAIAGYMFMDLLLPLLG